MAAGPRTTEAKPSVVHRRKQGCFTFLRVSFLLSDSRQHLLSDEGEKALRRGHDAGGRNRSRRTGQSRYQSLSYDWFCRCLGTNKVVIRIRLSVNFYVPTANCSEKYIFLSIEKAYPA